MRNIDRRAILIRNIDRRAYQFIGRANMNEFMGRNMYQFMGRRNQIEFFVRFKADRSLKCVQYDPYVYHVVYQ